MLKLRNISPLTSQSHIHRLWHLTDLPANAGDTGEAGSISEWGRSPGGRNDNRLQYSCLENPMNRGAWWATIYGVAKNQTGLNTDQSHIIYTSVDSLWRYKFLGCRLRNASCAPTIRLAIDTPKKRPISLYSIILCISNWNLNISDMLVKAQQPVLQGKN